VDVLHECELLQWKILLRKFIYHPIVLSSLDQDYF